MPIVLGAARAWPQPAGALGLVSEAHEPEGARAASDGGGDIVNPCDWDGESYCCESDGMPATHRVLTGMVGDTPVYEMVCCEHSVLGGVVTS